MVDIHHILQVHLGIGLFAMAGFSYIFGKNYIQTPLPTTRQLKSRAFLINIITFLYYSIENILYNTTNPSLQGLDPITLRYLHWGLTTPLILTDIMILDSYINTDIMFICILDIIMIICGYISYLATDPIAIWTLFSFGCLNGIILGIQMIKYIDKLLCKYQRNLNERAFIFLSWYMIVIWVCFPVIFILKKMNVISLEVELCSYVYLDIFAKGLFGMVIIGIRDKMHDVNSTTRLVRFANTIISIVPMERTDTTVVPSIDTNTIHTVNGDTPVPRLERSRSSLGDVSNAYSEIRSILSVRDKNLLENIPVPKRERARSSLGSSSDVYSEAQSIHSVRDTMLLENPNVNTTVVSVKPPAPMDTPPPRWQ